MGEERVGLPKKYRGLPGLWRIPAIGLPAIALTLTLMHWFHLTPFGFLLFPSSFLFMLIGAFLPLNFLWIPISGGARRDGIPWYDIILAALALMIPLYLIANQQQVMIGGWEAGAPLFPTIMGVMLWLLVIEAARRSAGWSLTIIVTFFSLYPLWASQMPVRILWGASLSFHKLVSGQIFSPFGLVGTVMDVFGELVMGFMVFAAVVQASGAGRFFNDIAVAVVGKARGGNAKVAIIASGFFASISGAAVPNVMTTGAFTIPAMKREGLPSHFAAGVEATASAGGTIMPPVMGTAAFIMSEFTGIPYANIAIAAFIPALLYFLCLFVQIDAYAARTRLKPQIILEKVPSVRLTLLRNFHILFGFLALVVILFLWRISAQAPYMASALIIVLSMVQKHSRYNLGNVLRLLRNIGRQLGDLLPILASVGLIIGGLSFSGVAFSIPYEISKVAGDNSFLLLLIGGIAALILGMGMTVSAVYIFMAIVIAPGLVQFGFHVMAVHLFVIYYGMLSHITPPVALAAFAASSIAESSPMKTGFTAMRLGIAKYILPFVFVYSPALILQGAVSEILWVIPSAAAGLTIIGGSLEGYMWRLGRITWPSRALMFAAGFMLVVPHATVSLIGIGSFVLIFAVSKLLAANGSYYLVKPPIAEPE